ncbi:hypothetical protein V8F06_011155 [Rhypophila decipiens]
MNRCKSTCLILLLLFKDTAVAECSNSTFRTVRVCGTAVQVLYLCMAQLSWLSRVLDRDRGRRVLSPAGMLPYSASQPLRPVPYSVSYSSSSWARRPIKILYHASGLLLFGWPVIEMGCHKQISRTTLFLCLLAQLIHLRSIT